MQAHSQPIDEQPVDFLSADEARRLFERQARTLLAMSGDEFIRRYDSGDFDDADDPRVARLASLLALVR